MISKNFYNIAIIYLLLLILQQFLYGKFIKFLILVLIFSPTEQILSHLVCIYFIPWLLDILPMDIVFQGFWHSLKHPKGLQLPYKLNFFLENIYMSKIKWICIASVTVIQLGLFKAEIGNFFWLELVRVLCTESWHIVCFSGRPYSAALILGICGISACSQLMLSVDLFINNFSFVNALLLFMSAAELIRSIPSISSYFCALFVNFQKITDFFNKRR